MTNYLDSVIDFIWAIAEIALAWILKAFGIFVVSLIAGFVAMLAIGEAHGQDHRVPAFGYWATFWLAYAVILTVSLAFAISSDD